VTQDTDQRQTKRKSLQTYATMVRLFSLHATRDHTLSWLGYLGCMLPETIRYRG